MTPGPLPGARLLAGTRRWFDPETVANIFEPLVADWQHEWLAAATVRERLKVQATGFLGALRAVAQIAPAWIVTPPPSGLAGPVLRRALSFCLIASAVLMYPFAVSSWRIANWETWLYLVPSAVVIPMSYVALPVAHRLRELSDESDHRVRRMLMQSIAILTVTSALMFGWVVPTANQEWRAVTYALITKNPNATPPVGGLRELTIPQLLSEARTGGRQQNAERELHKRLSLAFSPVVLAAIGWMAWGHRKRRAVTMFVYWIVVGACFNQLNVLGRGVEDVYSLPTGTGMWIPHLLVALGLVLYSIHRGERATATKYEGRV